MGKQLPQLQRTPLLCFLLLILRTLPTHAQTEHSSVRAAVDQLFTAMRTGDSTLLRQSFTPDATLQSVSTAADGTTKVSKDGVGGFIKAVGTPHTDVWDERIYDVKIQEDGPMAVVWAPYKFYRGTTFSHCGVNSFTLVRIHNQWKIASITDTRRKEPCP